MSIETKSKDNRVIDLTSPTVPRNDQECDNRIVCHSESMTEKMDHWYLDWRTNLLNDFHKLRLQFLEEAQQNILLEKRIQIKDYIHLNQTIKIMRDMLNHYEQTIDQKYQTEKNLNKAIDLLHKRILSSHRSHEERVVSVEKRREEIALSSAKYFYERKIKRKIFTNWKKFIEHQWKQQLELACEKRSKAIVNEYKFKCQQLEFELFKVNEERIRLRNEQNKPVKQALIRGVCAVNIEAMTVLFQDEQELKTIATRRYKGLADFLQQNDGI